MLGNTVSHTVPPLHICIFWFACLTVSVPQNSLNDIMLLSLYLGKICEIPCSKKLSVSQHSTTSQGWFPQGQEA